jgi:hypothetical protein
MAPAPINAIFMVDFPIIVFGQTASAVRHH